MDKKQNIVKKIKNIIHDKLLPHFFIVKELLILLRYYRVYKKTYNFLKKSQWMSEEEIEDFQKKQLIKLVTHAYKNVPYYKKLFNKHGLKPKDIKNLDDLKKIPFLTKEIIKKNVNSLKAKNFPDRKFEYITTGGSTGVPVVLYEEKYVSYIKEFAYSRIILERAGCNLTDKCVILRAASFSKNKKGKFWRYSFFGRMLNLSSFNMTEENLPEYIDRIRKMHPRYILTYPSSITILGKYMKRNNIEPFNELKVIICSAENLYEWQRAFLEDFFKCRVFEIYGHSEQAILACACEKSNYFHVFPEYGILELLDKKGKTVREEDEEGEIVATGFKNYIFPIIRYKTGDFGVNTNKKCRCGRNYPLIKNIKGRWLQDFIITKNKNPISIFAFNLHSNIFDNVKQYQFYQDRVGKVILNIVKAETYTDRDTEIIKKEISKKLGNRIDLEICFVDKLKRTKRAKHKYLIQKLPYNIWDLAKK